VGGALPIAKCRFASGEEQLKIANRQLAMNRPTRYREMVLTSLPAPLASVKTPCLTIT